MLFSVSLIIFYQFLLFLLTHILRNVDFGLMACCHKDSHHHQIKSAAKSLNISLGAAKDMITMGRIIQAGT